MRACLWRKRNRIQPCLNNFFEHVLVMAEENKLRRNRPALLQAISKVLLQMADYSQVVVKEEKPAPRKKAGSDTVNSSLSFRPCSARPDSSRNFCSRAMIFVKPAGLW